MPKIVSDPVTDPVTDLEAKSWDIEKNLSYVMGRDWDSFTHVSMIVYGCLNTFLPILKIFDSCTPPYHPIFGTSFRWIVVKNRQKIVKKSSKIVKNRQNRQNREKSLFEFGHLWTRNALVWVFWLIVNLF